MGNKQIVVIHGGDSFKTYEEYIESLHHIDMSLDRIRRRDWKSRLGETLGSEYDVLLPRMPNAQNARYVEWKIFFSHIALLLSPQVTLVGHSLGGIFLAKYLSEEVFPVSIRAVMLVAAPFNDESQYSLTDFTLKEGLPGFPHDLKTFLYHSKDDEVVPFHSLSQFRSALPHAIVRTFLDRGHMNQEEFPEIIEDIRW